MNVEHLMTRDVESCTPEATLTQAAMIMWRRDCGFVPVVEGPASRFAGVITDRDICIAAATKHVSPDSVRVGTVMNRRAVTCAPSDDAKVAMRRMGETQVRRLPVVDKDGKLMGVLSLNDLVLASERNTRREDESISYADVMGTFRAISAHRLPAALVLAT
jgi:CBS domain-containing protein